MKKSFALKAFAIFGVALSINACNCNGSVSGGGNPPNSLTDGGTCVAAGAACESGRPCCGGTCEGSVCSTGAFCQANGGSCTTGTDCCLNNCINGTCSTNLCTDVGQSCTSGSQCCTGTCTGGTCAALPGGSCKVLGQSCGSGAECCSTNCQGGVCTKAYYCQASGDICTSNDQCCGHDCSSTDGGAGRCVALAGGGAGGCVQGGEPCPTGGSNCCSRICFDPGSGVDVCLPAEGCRLTGTWCSSDQSCCGGGTNPNGSVTCSGLDVDAGITGRCDQGQACNPAGNICGAQVLPDGGINAPQDCCDGKKAVCKTDSSGIPRCFGGGSTNCPTGYGDPDAGCCIAAGQECQFKDQCCGGAPCVPGSDGVLRCTVGSCAAVGAACEPTSSTCCSGTECRTTSGGTYACQLPKPDAGTGDAGVPDAGTCSANGATCTTAGQCCSQLCTAGKCQTPAACQPQGAVCTSTADCCSGFSCNIPAGPGSGTCEPSVCTGAGQTCQTATDCCVGLNCVPADAGYVCQGVLN
jgi:hypothetical protein